MARLNLRRALKRLSDIDGSCRFPSQTQATGRYHRGLLRLFVLLQTAQRIRAEPLGGSGQGLPRLYAPFPRNTTIKRALARRVGSSELLGGQCWTVTSGGRRGGAAGIGHLNRLPIALVPPLERALHPCNIDVGPQLTLTISTEISTAGVVPLFSSQCVVFLSSGQPTPSPYSLATPFRWSVIVPCSI